MSSESNNSEVDRIFNEIKTKLPEDWLSLSEELRLHHVLSAINETLKPNGSWILVNGNMTLLDLINEKSGP